MRTIKQLGIWMDHANAIMMELSNDKIFENKIVSGFTHQEKEFSLSKNENLMHNKEQHLQNGYYKELSEKIRNFDEVILFGPTNAKDELFNLLKTNHRFNSTKVDVKHADKMTENQMHAFVRSHFKSKIKAILI